MYKKPRSSPLSSWAAYLDESGERQSPIDEISMQVLRACAYLSGRCGWVLEVSLAGNCWVGLRFIFGQSWPPNASRPTLMQFRDDKKLRPDCFQVPKLEGSRAEPELAQRHYID
jgi:hypothetical protein